MSGSKVTYPKTNLNGSEDGILNFGLPSLRNFPAFCIPKIAHSGNGSVPSSRERMGPHVLPSSPRRGSILSRFY